MGEATPVDDRGRFTIRPEFRKLLGLRVEQVLTPRGLLLRPIGKLDFSRLPPARAASGEEAAMDEVG